MADKGNQPQKKMGIIEQFRLGIIDSFKVPVLHPPKEKKNKRGLYADHGRKGTVQKRWFSHGEMLMDHKRIKRRRRRDEIAKQSRRLNRAT